MDTFFLDIPGEGPAVLEYPVPLGTLMSLYVQIDEENARAFPGKSRADFQGWRLAQVQTRGLPDGAYAKIETFTSLGNVTLVAEGTVRRAV
jgi:hypothetical protein